jgi:putative hydrolase of the HAD superfamily
VSTGRMFPVPLQTVFLDAGGVLVYPNWTRISDVLRRHGVQASAAALAAAEPHAKRRLDITKTIQVTNDTARGWLYFNLILEHAGVSLSDATNAALAELHAYHMTNNLWEFVPPYVPSVLAGLRARGLRLVVVSNSNGTLRSHFRKLGLDTSFECVLDSCEEGVEKPDARIFHNALARSGATAATTIHVGDLYEVDVVGARAAGIRPVLLDEGGLYPDVDCTRLTSMGELLQAIDERKFD